VFTPTPSAGSSAARNARYFANKKSIRGFLDSYENFLSGNSLFAFAPHPCGDLFLQFFDKFSEQEIHPWIS